MPQTTKKQGSRRPSSGRVFGQGGSKTRAGLYARVSTHDQQTLPMQLTALRQYARKRGWAVAMEVQEVASGAKDRPARQRLVDAAKRREVDAIVVWRLDRWGRSLPDLVTTLRDLTAVDVGFISLSEALDLTTPSGRALAGMLAVFAEFEREILRERVKAGIAQARKDGKPHGRPRSAAKLVGEMRALRKKGVSNRQIAERLGVSVQYLTNGGVTPVS